MLTFNAKFFTNASPVVKLKFPPIEPYIIQKIELQALGAIVISVQGNTHDNTVFFQKVKPSAYRPMRLNRLVHGSHLEQRVFAGTKCLGRYQVQASRFMAQVIVFVIIYAMISND